MTAPTFELSGLHPRAAFDDDNREWVHIDHAPRETLLRIVKRQCRQWGLDETKANNWSDVQLRRYLAGSAKAAEDILGV